MRTDIVERRLKERLIGASVLVMLAVIFIPMILDNSGQYDSEISGTNIPDRPGGDFSSRIVPIEQGQPVNTIEPPTEVVLSPESTIVEMVQDTEIAQETDLGAIDEQTDTTQVEETNTIITEDTKKASTPRVAEVGITAWVVQLGSFGKEENADNLNKRLREMGFTAFVEPLNQPNGTIYRVRVGPELLRSDAVELQKVLNEKIQTQGIIVKYP